MSDRLPGDPTPEEIAERMEQKRDSENDSRATDEMRRYREYRLSLPTKRVRE